MKQIRHQSGQRIIFGQWQIQREEKHRFAERVYLFCILVLAALLIYALIIGR